LNAEIIAIGSELLLGQIVNTNAQVISKQLANIGVNVYYHSAVGDNESRLADQISQAQKRSNLIIFTGGLGPTKDDLTKETVATCVGRSLTINEAAIHKIELHFKKLNRVMTENNRKQALVINDSTILPNDNGMAPGMAFKDNGIYYLLLPGPPKEMEPMFTKYGLSFILSKQEKSTQITSRVLNFFGIGESLLETEILDLIETQTNPTIAPLVKDGEVTIRLTVKHESSQVGEELLDELEKKILTRVGKFFYGYNDTSLLNEVSNYIRKQNKTVAAAESLTGGRFSAEMTATPGSSQIFKGGIICYDSEVKHTILQVPREILNQYGAVSKESASCLAENVRELLNADIGISFTGVAGPSPLEDVEVGTVFIAVSVQGEKTEVYHLKLAGTREQITSRSVKHGLYSLLKQF
jgi:nicotinamide-nucleotide amidase